MQHQLDLPTRGRDLVADATAAVDVAVDFIRRLQQVRRVGLRDTPFGPVLALDQSV